MPRHVFRLPVIGSTRILREFIIGGFGVEESPTFSCRAAALLQPRSPTLVILSVVMRFMHARVFNASLFAASTIWPYYCPVAHFGCTVSATMDQILKGSIKKKVQLTNIALTHSVYRSLISSNLKKIIPYLFCMLYLSLCLWCHKEHWYLNQVCDNNPSQFQQ